jgi:hypothetical protein
MSAGGTSLQQRKNNEPKPGMGNLARFVKNVIYHARFTFCVISRITQSRSKFKAFWVSAGTIFSPFFFSFKILSPSFAPSRDLIGGECSDIPSSDTDSVLDFKQVIGFHALAFPVLCKVHECSPDRTTWQQNTSQIVEKGQTR